MSVAQSKAGIIDMIEQMPEMVTVPDVIKSLSLRLEIEKAEQEIASGDYIEHEEMEKKIDQWLTK